MDDESGRRNLVESPVDIKPAAWGRVVEWAREGFLHYLGRPARLEAAIKSGQLVPINLTPPADTLWTRSVIYWHTWREWSSMSFHRDHFTIDYRKPGYNRRLESHSLAVPEVENLVKEETIPDFSCDITDIKGISASKSEGHDIGDIDEFPVLRCPEFIEPVTAQHLQQNMQHWELRLDSMRFAEFPWSERRYYWLNDGGSHHFAAARYQASRLNQAVPLAGKLHRYTVDADMVSALRDKWHLFVIPHQEVFGSFFDAMNAFECPFAHSAMPRNVHNEFQTGVSLRLIWLERDNTRASAVAELLSAAGFPDFGKQLDILALGRIS